MRTSLGVGLALLLAACGGDDAATPDAGSGSDTGGTDLCATDPSNLAPLTLAETGLCKDAGCTQFCPGVIEYAPQYQLYSDNAAKRRWIQLPAGTQIDTTDMNYWKFPVGTKLWKEFTTPASEGNVRIETRLVWKQGADDTLQASFYMASYGWNTTQDATTLASPTDGVIDANGTTHDIPSRVQCRTCHNGVPGRILGVNAISMDYSSTTLDLSKMIAMNMLSTPPAAPTSAGTGYFPLPGDATAKAAFGYLHANCGHCHNPTSPVYSNLASNMSLRLDTDPAKRDLTTNVPAYATTHAQNGTVGDAGMGYHGLIVDAANPDASVMLLRLKTTVQGTRMPQIGIEINDQTGIAAVQAWIDALQ
ncbi:MAG TPA: hypothetical protein VGM90_02195 [Kofleriaceae bacterium]